MFGSDDLPIPPSCLITVWAKLAQDTEEHLSYPVSLIGVNCDAEAIYIDRFLEKGTNTTTIKPDSNTASSLSRVTDQDPFNHVLMILMKYLIHVKNSVKIGIKTMDQENDTR